MQRCTVRSVADPIDCKDLFQKAGLESQKRKLNETGDMLIGCFFL